MRALLLLGVVLGTASATLVPRAADGQGVWHRVKARATAKANAKKDSVNDRVVATAGATTDSALDKTARGADSAIAVIGSVADTMIERTQRGVAHAFVRDGSGDEGLAAALAAGRATVTGIVFDPLSGAMSPASETAIARLAAAIKGGPTTTYLIEGHVAPSQDAALDAQRSQQHAVAIKAALVARGISDGRLFAMGLGATRPPAVAGAPAERIEVARMQ